MNSPSYDIEDDIEDIEDAKNTQKNKTLFQLKLRADECKSQRAYYTYSVSTHDPLYSSTQEKWVGICFEYIYWIIVWSTI